MLACRVGGSIVYSTCTMSTAQNQAVVEACLQELQEDGRNRRFAVVNPSSLLRRLSTSFTGLHAMPAFASTLVDRSLLTNDPHVEPPIGIQVLPRLAANYGPTFICRLRRLE